MTARRPENEPQKKILVSLSVYPNKGPVFGSAFFPLIIEVCGNGLSDTKTLGLCTGSNVVHRCMVRPHSANLIGELRFAENGVFSVTRPVGDKTDCYRFLLSVNVYRNKGSVFGGPLQLQIMELTEEEP